MPIAYSLRRAPTLTEPSQKTAPISLYITVCSQRRESFCRAVMQYFGLYDLTFYGADDIGLQGL